LSEIEFKNPRKKQHSFKEVERLTKKTKIISKKDYRGNWDEK
jgi:hypothetical protein